MLLLTHKCFVFTRAVPCPVGEFSRSGLTPCYPCPRDYYQPNPGKSFCLSCPFYGTTASSGAGSITDCSSKKIHFISYVIAHVGNLRLSCGNRDSEYYYSQWMWVSGLAKLSFGGLFDDSDSKILILGALNLITSTSLSKSLGFSYICHPSIWSLFYCY